MTPPVRLVEPCFGGFGQPRGQPGRRNVAELGIARVTSEEGFVVEVRQRDGHALSAGARLLYVIHVERGARDRIIGARLATAPEEALYSDR